MNDWPNPTSHRQAAARNLIFPHTPRNTLFGWFIVQELVFRPSNAKHAAGSEFKLFRVPEVGLVRWWRTVNAAHPITTTHCLLCARNGARWRISNDLQKIRSNGVIRDPERYVYGTIGRCV